MSDMEEEDKLENKIRMKDRFARWQSKTNEQFGYFNNLLLILSIGTLGFVVNILVSEDFIINNCWAKVFFGLGIISLLFSITSGTYLGYNRLKDFRKTTKKILARIEKDGDALELLKEQTKYLGKLSWNLLRVQFTSFLMGEFLIIFSLGIIFGYKLF